MPQDTVTITDNRTGQTYTLPIENGTIRAMDPVSYTHLTLPTNREV